MADTLDIYAAGYNDAAREEADAYGEGTDDQLGLEDTACLMEEAAALLRAQHEALKPFAQLASEVDFLKHSDSSTSLHRLYARDLRRARKLIGGEE